MQSDGDAKCLIHQNSNNEEEPLNARNAKTMENSNDDSDTAPTPTTCRQKRKKGGMLSKICQALLAISKALNPSLEPLLYGLNVMS